MNYQLHEKYEESQLYRIRHSAAHVMAQAVVEMFEPGEAKFAIGPPIENGFYYDFDLPRNLTPKDLKAIEKRMRQIISKKHPFEKKVVSADEAKDNGRFIYSYGRYRSHFSERKYIKFLKSNFSKVKHKSYNSSISKPYTIDVLSDNE